MDFNSEDIVTPNKTERKLILPEELNLLPIKDTVLFPMAVLPIIVNREGSMKLVDDVVVAQNRMIAMASLKDQSVDEPKFENVYPIGTINGSTCNLIVPQ